MNNEEKYINELELLKLTLSFYANADNYKDNKLIMMDLGEQARFALDRLKQNDLLTNEFYDNYFKSNNINKSNNNE